MSYQKWHEYSQEVMVRDGGESYQAAIIMAKELHKMSQQLAEAKETIECYEAMKAGFTIRATDLERNIEACRRYFEHTERVSISQLPCASKEMAVRQALKQEAKEACGL